MASTNTRNPQNTGLLLDNLEAACQASRPRHAHARIGQQDGRRAVHAHSSGCAGTVHSASTTSLTGAVIGLRSFLRKQPHSFAPCVRHGWLRVLSTSSCGSLCRGAPPGFSLPLQSQLCFPNAWGIAWLLVSQAAALPCFLLVSGMPAAVVASCSHASTCCAAGVRSTYSRILRKAAAMGLLRNALSGCWDRGASAPGPR